MPRLKEAAAALATADWRRRLRLLLLPITAMVIWASSLVAVAPASAAQGQALRPYTGPSTRSGKASQPAPEGPSGTSPTANRAIPLLTPDPAGLRRAKAAAASRLSGAAPFPPTLSPLPKASVFNGLNKAGMSAEESGGNVTPPDTTGAIGPSNYVEFVNGTGITAYDRELNAVSGPVALEEFINHPSDEVFDPQIQWDVNWGRWIYAMDDIEGKNKNYIAFGWSKTADPTDLSTEQPGKGLGAGWCEYFIGTGKQFDDYPKLGHSSSGITIGTNVYRAFFEGSRLWSIAKPANPQTCPELGTGAIGATELPLESEGELAFTPVPANTADSSANSYVVAADTPFGGETQIMGWHISGAGASATLVEDGNMEVASYAVPANVPQPGTTQVIDSLDGRLTNAVAVSDPAVGEEAVWTQHTVDGPGGHSVVRWYELLPGTQTVRQEGTISDPSQFVFNGAISPTKHGDAAAVDFNRGSSTLFPDMHAQSRDPTTPLGETEGDVLLGTSEGHAVDFSCHISKGEPCRWGDYAGASPDPVQAGVVWGSNQGLAAPVGEDSRWTTRNFALVVAHTLKLEKTGSGDGTVTSAPAGINCGPGCEEQEASFEEGETVLLTASASGSSTFDGWTGCDEEPGPDECKVTIGANKTVTAEFNATLLTHSLTLTKTGSGGGTLAAECEEGSGFEPCANPLAEIPDGTEVKVTATPDPGSTLGALSGTNSASGCSGSPCTFTLSADSEVTAQFNLLTHSLTLTKTGSGGGTLAAECEEGSGFEPCANPLAEIPDGTEVKVTATPDPGSTLGALSGTNSASGCSGSPCTFTLSADSEVTAQFNLLTHSLTLTKTGSGGGTLAAECEEGSGFEPCANPLAEIPDGTEVKVTATPDPGSTLGALSGTNSASGCSGSPCTFTLSADSEVTAQFNLLTHSLTLTKTGSGGGTLAAECEEGSGFEPCANPLAEIPDGTEVKVTATPDPGSTLGALSGTNSASGCSGSPCTFTLSADSEVTAQFNLLTHSLTLTKTGSGGGTLAAECEEGSGFEPCANPLAEIPDGTEVKVTATPDPGSTLGALSGTNSASGCSGSPCTFTLSADSEVTAQFNLLTHSLTLTKTGSGGGTLAAECEEGSGFEPCANPLAEIPDGTEVKVTATPDPGSTLGALSGTNSASGCSGSPCTFTLSADSEVTAQFNLLTHSLTLTKTGSGGGTLAAECEEGSGFEPCANPLAEIPDGTEVKVTATPDPGSTLGALSGTNSASGCSGSPCTFTLSADSEVTAQFNLLTHSLTLTKTGSGGGTLAAECEEGSGFEPCANPLAEIPDGTEVKVTATPDPGSTLGALSGTNSASGCSGSPCTFTLSADSEVTAQFNLLTHSLTLTKTGSGGGTLAAECEEGSGFEPCANPLAEIPDGTEVKVTATPDPGSTLGALSGTNSASGCSGSPCTFTLSADSEVTAQFNLLTHSLTLTKTGSGGGTLAAECEEGSGFEPCANPLAEIPDGTEVKVTATPDPGSTLGALSGTNSASGCSGSPCTFTLSADSEVTAQFNLLTHSLTLTKTGSGGGTLAAECEEGSGFEPCANPLAEIPDGTEVKVTATPDPGSTLGALSGTNSASGCSGSPCTFTLSADSEVTAQFNLLTHSLTLTKTGSGGGTLAAECEEGSGFEPCANPLAEIPDGTEVKVTATPDPGSTLGALSGTNSASGCSGSPCTFTLSADSEVTAQFNLLTHSLTLTKTGSGGGTLAAECEEGSGFEPCANPLAEIPDGTEVKVTATPDPGSTLGALSGTNSASGCSGSPCTFTLSADSEVTAQFNLLTHSLTLTKTGSGGGTLAAECEEGSGFEPCANPLAEIPDGTEVKVTATPDPGSTLGALSGTNSASGCSGSPCTFTLSADSEVTAQFNLLTHSLTLTKTGSGGGTLAAECEEGSGFEPCANPLAEIPDGTEVKVTATPDPGSTLGALSGTNSASGCSGSPCTFTLSADSEVTAQFNLLTHSLTLTKTGSGGGTLAAECEEGSGFEPCANPLAEIPDGTEVKVTATPDPGSTLGALSGTNSASGCSGSPCTFTLSADSEVTAQFNLLTHSLTLTKTGSGGGTLAAECEEGSGFEPCANPLAEIPDGTEVKVTATPDPGSTLGALSGTNSASGCSGSPCTFTLSADSEVTAQFNLLTHSLTLTKTGSGGGTLAAECEEGSGFEPCANPLAEIPDGTEVKVTATPDPGSTLGALSGTNSASGCSGSPCTFTLSADSEVTAQFNLLTHSLTLTKTGSGGGTLAAECEEGSGFEPCANPLAEIPDGTEVKVTATPDPGSTLGALSGTNSASGCSGSPCTFTLSADSEVTAEFNAGNEGGGGGGAAGGGGGAAGGGGGAAGGGGGAESGIAVAKKVALVKGGKALLKLTCRGAGACRGSLKLIVRVKAGKGKRSKKRVRNLVIGRAGFVIPAGRAKTIRVRLTGKGKRLLRKAGKHGLKVKLRGRGVRNRNVRLRSVRKHKGGRPQS